MAVPRLRHTPDLYRYRRRATREVSVGGVVVGGDHPIRVQSMLTSDTLDTAACVAETLGLVEAGCEIVRITAQTVRHAANLEHIVADLRARGCETPIVADIHFKPDAAMEAARWVEKVRVNPGNYADSKKFAVREYSDAQYLEEIERIRGRFSPLVERCKARGIAMRIGTNHGSLSDRIMNRYGDSPLGMVESALEFARIARDLDYHDFIFSMKASNPKVMIEAYRLLVARLSAEGASVTLDPDTAAAERQPWNYPLHLGVTEAGDGEDGRIKSAIGIGSLLADGIGDTIRVSLTEDAVEEVPVARALCRTVVKDGRWKMEDGKGPEWPFDPFDYVRRGSAEMEIQGVALGGEQTIRVVTSRRKWDAVAHKLDKLGDFQPEIVYEDAGVREIDPRDDAAVAEVNGLESPVLVTVVDGIDLPVIAAFRLLAARVDARHPVLLKDALGSSCGFQPQKVAAASSRRDVRELRQDAAATFLDPDREVSIGSGTSLPHWTQDGATYAVTFRLEDSLPQSVREEYSEEKSRLEVLLKKEKECSDSSPAMLDSLRRQLEDLYSEKIEAALDAGHGACWLRDDRVAQMVHDALKFFEGDRYDLFAWAVMPNHVHLVLRPNEGHELSDILHSLKSFTSSEANKILQREGTFWQKESYDHLVRDEEDFWNQVRYVMKNPESAGLKDWKWVGSSCGEVAAASSRSGGEGLRLEAAATPDFLDTLLTASTHIGSLLCDGIGDAILIQGEEAPGQSLRLSYNILQGAGARIFKTDYVACPSCGRTLFNLQETTQKIRAATGHLKGVRIAIMGCIVNGPGEMADADFGYVGGAPGKINLYVGKTPVEFNIPEAEAVDRLIDLIAEHGKWTSVPLDPEAASPQA